MAKTVKVKRRKRLKKSKSIKKKNYRLKKGGFDFVNIDTSKVHPASIVLGK
jgi:hypothetical protein